MKGGSDEFKAHHKLMTSSNGSVVFTDSFGTGFSNSTWDVEFMVSVDPGTLNRAEWINFVAAFFNEEAQGDGNWCHCGVLYKLSTAHYKRDMVEDAGGRQ